MSNKSKTIKTLRDAVLEREIADAIMEQNWFAQIKIGTSDSKELCLAVAALLEQRGFASRIKGYDGKFSVYRSLCANVDGITRVVPDGSDWM